MKVESFQDLLEWTSGFHQHLSDAFVASAKNQSDKRSRMLLNHLADKEVNLASNVSAFKDIAAENALDSWCTAHIDQHPLMNNSVSDDAFVSMNTTNIISKVEEQHQQIILLYQNLGERKHSEKMQQLLLDVHDLEKQQAQQMMQGANNLEDI